MNTPDKSERLNVSQTRKASYVARLSETLPDAPKQLDLWMSFANDVAQEYTAILELFDAIPKFYAGAVTSARTGASLDIVSRKFRWNDQDFTIQIKPIIVGVTGKPGDAKLARKEIIAAEREETIYRVLRKMASDPLIRRRPHEKSNSVTIEFTIYEVSRRLREINRGLSNAEIREALQVLAETPMRVVNETLKREIYAGSYIGLEYISEQSDESGERTLCAVTFNKLATVAIVNGLYDRIHYLRLMTLETSLAQWLYETMTRQFRQAEEGRGFSIQLSRILREGPMRPYAELRKAAQKVREAIDNLERADIVSTFPPMKEVIEFERGKGRPKIVEIVWTLFPTHEFVRDVRSDNASRASREERRLKSVSASKLT